MKCINRIVLGALSLTLCLPAFAKWPEGAKPFATATLEPKSGTQSTGSFDFAKSGDDLLIKITLGKVSVGPHAFHVHETGDCSAPDGASAGEHFNPTKEKHGGPEGHERHTGDFGNVTVSKDGTADSTVTIKNRKDKPYNWDEIVGKSIILHKGKDDLKSQPSGNSGDRIACGVIRRAP